ncbi:MAG TPA: NIL domain-containing protein [Candidatus Caenarcaniphilales bacterium]|jgi:ABC-type methionine transport system ATPase subunit
MATYGRDNPSVDSLHAFQPTQPSVFKRLTEDNRFTKTRVRLRIPKDYQQEPVISRLVSEHGLTVNISAALLAANAREDGWFDLELRGTGPQIQSALVYFSELDLETWSKPSPEEDDW